MRFLRNLTADVILVVGLFLLALVAGPLILVEVLFHTGNLNLVIWGVIIFVGYKVWRKIR